MLYLLGEVQPSGEGFASPEPCAKVGVGVVNDGSVEPVEEETTACAATERSGEVSVAVFPAPSVWEIVM